MKDAKEPELIDDEASWRGRLPLGSGVASPDSSIGKLKVSDAAGGQRGGQQME